MQQNAGNDPISVEINSNAPFTFSTPNISFTEVLLEPPEGAEYSALFSKTFQDIFDFKHE